MVRRMLPLVLVRSGCRSMDSAAKPVTLPSASAITAIEVTPNFGEPRTTSVITNPDQIERFVAFVNSRNSGWNRPWHTFPAGMFTVVAKCGDERVGVFWPSPGHIGGHAGDKDAESKRLHPLSNEDWRELEAILEIDGTKAPGIDGVTVDQYEADLRANLLDLETRLHRQSYHPQPSLRCESRAAYRAYLTRHEIANPKKLVDLIAMAR